MSTATPAPPSPVAGKLAASSERRQARRETIGAILRSKTFIVGGLIVGFWVLCALVGPLIAPYDPYDDNPYYQHAGPGTLDYVLGTDRLGRDILSRVINGARPVLVIAPLATVLATVVGTALGLVMGYYRGRADDVFGRVVDTVLSLPVILVALLAVTAVGPSTLTLVLTIGLLFAPIIARTVRAAVFSERDLEYVSAARLRGERGLYVMGVEILPNIMGPILVEFTVRLGYAVFVLASLSFLGFGVQAPTPDWGLMVSEEYNQISAGFWWPTLFPALAIASLVIAVNLVADGIQAVVDR